MSDETFEVYAAGIPFPEGPVFDSEGNLFVCARRRGDIVKVGTDRGVERFLETGGKPNGLAIAPDGRLYVADAVRREILTVEPDGKMSVLIPTVFDHLTLIGPNDLCFGASRALYFTDPGLSLPSAEGAVYRYCPGGGRLARLAEGLAFPNGLAVTVDEKTLFVAETVTSRLLAIDLTQPPSSSLRVVAEFGKDSFPDGMAWLDGERLLVTLHATGELALLQILDSTERRVLIAKDSHPTNVRVNENRCYVTDDARQAVLTRALAGNLSVKNRSIQVRG